MLPKIRFYQQILAGKFQALLPQQQKIYNKLTSFLLPPNQKYYSKNTKKSIKNSRP